jgi:hypothetical protein
MTSRLPELRRCGSASLGWESGKGRKFLARPPPAACLKPPAHVPRPSPRSLYAQSGRMPLPLQAPRRPKRGARSRTLLHLSPARFQRRAGVVKGRCRLPTSHVLRPGPFTHKAAGCRFYFRLHAVDQSEGRGPARYSTRRPPDLRVARTAKLQRARVAKAASPRRASPRPLRQGRFAKAASPPCHRPFRRCAC